jgi:glycine cleavage system regulatory protein
MTFQSRLQAWALTIVMLMAVPAAAQTPATHAAFPDHPMLPRDVEIELAPRMVVLRYDDVPGVIGQVGTILGKHKVNIANFSLGRRMGATDEQSKGKAREAIAVVHVDGRVPEGVLKVLRKVAAIEQAKAIRLF